MDRRERKFRRQAYYEDPVNGWVNVFKGAFLAIVCSKALFILGELTYELVKSYWANL